MNDRPSDLLPILGFAAYSYRPSTDRIWSFKEDRKFGNPWLELARKDVYKLWLSVKQEYAYVTHANLAVAARTGYRPTLSQAPVRRRSTLDVLISIESKLDELLKKLPPAH